MISFESSNNPEIPTQEQVISLFKEEGETIESKKLYSLWFQEEQKKADESDSKYSRLKLNITVALLLFKSNMSEDAYTYLDDAMDMFENESYGFNEDNIPEELLAIKVILDKIIEDYC